MNEAVKADKEESERKGSAVPLPGGAQAEVLRVGGNSEGLLSRLLGRLRPDSWGAAPGISARPGVQALGGFFSGLSVGGKLALAGLVMALGGAGFIGYSVLQNRGERGETPNPDLSAVDSTLKIHKRNHDGSRSLSYLADASKGELSWPVATAARPAAKPPEKEAPKEEAPPAAAPTPADLMGQAGGPGQGSVALKPQLGASSFGSILNAGGGSGGGGSGQAQAGKGGLGGDSLASAGNAPTDPIGRRKLTAVGSGRTPALSQGIGAAARRRMGNAMNQLKFAKAMSGKGAATSVGETGASYGSQGFDNNSVPGAAVGGGAGLSQGSPGGIAAPGGAAQPSSGGGTVGNGGSDSNPDSGAAPDIIGKDQTPYQDLLDGAQEKYSQALMALIAGIALILAGLALMIYAGWTGIGLKIGLVMVAVGVGLLGLALGLYMMAQQMNSVIEKQFGQADQAAISGRQGAGVADLLRSKGYNVPGGSGGTNTNCGADRDCVRRMLEKSRVPDQGGGAPAVKGVPR